MPGYDLLVATYHQAYGAATYIKSNMENASVISASNITDIQIITTEIEVIAISNVYKSLSRTWPPQVLKTYPLPVVFIGDFNSHHEQWKKAWV